MEVLFNNTTSTRFLPQTKTKSISLLKACEDHGYQLGYRWNPKKWVIPDPTLQPIPYILYDETILLQSFFSYLGIPFCPSGYTNGLELPNANIIKALSTLNQLPSIGLHSKGFVPLLFACFYSKTVRAQLEYGLAITKITSFLTTYIEDAQNTCLRRTFGSSSQFSTKVMLHMAKLLEAVSDASPFLLNIVPTRKSHPLQAILPWIL
ncbi:hypothetical protein G6F47_002176 [Rhizopus delemar]|nr:hypothetical protein G6F54_003184 [Rhizopus delemar]KAG1513778.1 hypothetical protein G6F53_004173 [Rhizopus delemar]KAG1603067.1 hypothetical protein G6F47_002176 [Rhizopus delemar]